MSRSQLLETALSLLLQATLVVGASALLARRLRTAAARDRLWNACFAALALLPLADLALPHLRLLPAPLPRAGNDGFAESAMSFAVHSLLIVWGAGSTLLVLRLLRDMGRLARLFRVSAAAPDELVEQIRSQLGAGDSNDPLLVERQPVRILFGATIDSPSCWQLQRPTVVLPEVMRSFASDETALIVRHELAHLQFRHPLALFVQRLVQVVFWVHPAVWWASRQAERDREFRCDDAAVATRSSALIYLRAILRLASPERPEPTPGAALGFGAECPLIVDRAERLASRDWTIPLPRERSWRAAAPLLCAVLAMVMLWIPVGPAASRRSAWSPWPTWTAAALRSVGVTARDYEIDGHRLRPEEYRRARPE